MKKFIIIGEGTPQEEKVYYKYIRRNQDGTYTLVGTARKGRSAIQLHQLSHVPKTRIWDFRK